MKTKLVVVADDGLQIPVLAIQMTPDSLSEHRILTVLCEYKQQDVLLLALDPLVVTDDPFAWPKLGVHPRTLPLIHQHLAQHFDNIPDGSVIDVMELVNGRINPKPDGAAS